jgi:DNA (cytosine-5)-methyltransferase 1
MGIKTKYKILNNYCGIGGNRKLWGNEHEITAVELNPEIAAIYKDFFPNDNVIIADAHEYLLKYFKEYDFIWSSPPCPSHSRLNTFAVSNGVKELEYPDMKLYEEIILMQQWNKKGLWVIENVIPYYEPLIHGKELDRHLFWSNFLISDYEIKDKKKPHKEANQKYLQDFLGYDLSKYTGINKTKILRNCVLPETGLHILNCANGIYQHTKDVNQTELFK